MCFVGKKNPQNKTKQTKSREKRKPRELVWSVLVNLFQKTEDATIQKKTRKEITSERLSRFRSMQLCPYFFQIPVLYISKVQPGIKEDVPKHCEKDSFQMLLDLTEAGHGKKIMRNPYCLRFIDNFVDPRCFHDLCKLQIFEDLSRTNSKIFKICLSLVLMAH